MPDFVRTTDAYEHDLGAGLAPQPRRLPQEAVQRRTGAAEDDAPAAVLPGLGLGTAARDSKRAEIVPVDRGRGVFDDISGAGRP